MIAAIILSAGSSRRFGSPKALVRFGDETIIERLQTMLLQTPVQQIIIVLGPQINSICPYIFKHRNIKTVYNKDHKFGQTSSFQKGLLSLTETVTGIMLFPVDYPFVRKETVNALIAAFERDKADVTIPLFEDKKGHPPLFHSHLKSDILNLKTDVGLNTITKDTKYKIKFVQTKDRGVLQTFNTPEELQRLTHQVE